MITFFVLWLKFSRALLASTSLSHIPQYLPCGFYLPCTDSLKLISQVTNDFLIAQLKRLFSFFCFEPPAMFDSFDLLLFFRNQRQADFITLVLLECQGLFLPPLISMTVLYLHHPFSLLYWLCLFPPTCHVKAMSQSVFILQDIVFWKILIKTCYVFGIVLGTLSGLKTEWYT